MNKRILVVDDDLFIRDIYEEILKNAGYKVETAIDGEEGLTKLQNGGYSVILLDINMPKKNGLEILKILMNKPPKKPNGPILLLTNSVEKSVIEEAEVTNVHKCLVKADLTPAELLKNVQNVFYGIN
jgi:CheY-like chemotaxis protein